MNQNIHLYQESHLNAMSNAKLLVNSSSNKSGFKSCLDIAAKKVDHGEYFTPLSSACLECLCVNGTQDHCISVVCPKPKCPNYKEIPGKCCEYKCPDLTMNDNTTLAIVVTLSCLLFIILSATAIIWLKLRNKKKFGERLGSIASGNSSNLDISSLIRHNSIPNNTRFTNNLKTMNVDCSNAIKANIDMKSDSVFEINNSNISKSKDDINKKINTNHSVCLKDNNEHLEDNTKLLNTMETPHKLSYKVIQQLPNEISSVV
ncbi:integral membrane protein DGCR2/IDD isoform X1 [Hydra vulgaris]|uniref:integral membrane protein DGCR2/IDD isoform X1 n=1 Tax=Hydra vulgaris TaxID=6087 RepID=UPI000641225D|nr:integral membrane protein DGCR2/IDD isoform X1 [Hydra vulgaris]